MTTHVNEARPTDDLDDDISTGTGFLFAGLAALFAFQLVVIIGAVVYGFEFGGATDEQRQAEEVAGNVSEQADIGEVIFASRCAACHGVSGEGGIGPSFDGVKIRYPDPVSQAMVVAEGRGQMPSFAGQLSPDQIMAVVTYERERLDID